MTLFSFLLATFVTTTFAFSKANSLRVVHEKRGASISSKGPRVQDDAIIPIRIGLKQSNLDSGYDAVMDVSDPKSSNYGNHWTLEEVHTHFAPSDENIAAVMAWLTESGIEDFAQSDDRQWIAINIPTETAERLLGAKYHEHYDEDGSVRIGCDEYSLPGHISPHVDFIKPGVTLSPPLKKRTIKRADVENLLGVTVNSDSSSPSHPHYGNAWYNHPEMPGPPPRHMPPYHGPHSLPPNSTLLPENLRTCGFNITPACVRALYNIPRNRFKTSSNTLGVVQFGLPGNTAQYSQADLNMFFQQFAPYVPQGTHPKLDSINGARAPTTQSHAGDEADLDFQIVFPLVYPQSVTLYQVARLDYNNSTQAQVEKEVTFVTPFLDAIDGSYCTRLDRRMGFQCGVYPLTKVVSVSYLSFNELLNGQPAVTRACNEFMKLSLQGHTILFASGDYGVGGYATHTYNYCLQKDLRHLNGYIFAATFPSVCPYVLSVGGTELYSNETINDPEYVMNVDLFTGLEGTFSSGGGFSNYFKRPSYQDWAVQHYLDNYVPGYPYYVYNGHDPYSNKSNAGQNGGRYNRVGRGYPDVSANGANYTIFYRGREENFFGTSAATPVWASIFTLINEERTRLGKGPVGFVNPTLYAHPEVFTDITRGTNPGCGTQGFPAVPGWDPSSGLGTPKFPELLKLFTGLGGWQKGGHQGWNSGNETTEHSDLVGHDHVHAQSHYHHGRLDHGSH